MVCKIWDSVRIRGLSENLIVRRIRHGIIPEFGYYQENHLSDRARPTNKLER